MPELLATRTPASVLAWSESRVDEAAGTPGAAPSIALWLPEGVTAAIGIGQTPEAELDVDAMRRDGAGLVRRQSGGGAVLLYPGVLCWEAWADTDAIAKITGGTGGDGAGIRPSYAALSLPVIRALAGMGIAAFHAGICDISTQAPGWPRPRKLAGTAQLRRKRNVLVHGSLLVNPDLAVLSRYLKFPSEQPDYREGRAHGDFCASVAELAACDTGSMAQAIVREAEIMGWRVMTPPSGFDGGKYSRDAWNWNRIRSAS